MQVLDMKSLKDRLKPGTEYIQLETGGKVQQINLLHLQNGVAARWFFVCPECGKKILKIYLAGSWMCCKCACLNPYAGIQNRTKGGAEELLYRMQRYAEKKNIQIRKLPFCYKDYETDSRLHRETFRKDLKVLQALDNMRLQAVLFGTRYKAALIKKVTSGNHPLMQLDIHELYLHLYNWKTCQKIFLPEEMMDQVIWDVVKHSNRGKH